MFDYKKERVVKEKGGGVLDEKRNWGAGRGVVLWDWVTDGEKSQTQEASKALLRAASEFIKGRQRNEEIHRTSLCKKSPTAFAAQFCIATLAGWHTTRPIRPAPWNACVVI